MAQRRRPGQVFGACSRGDVRVGARRGHAASLAAAAPGAAPRPSRRGQSATQPPHLVGWGDVHADADLAQVRLRQEVRHRGELLRVEAAQPVRHGPQLLLCVPHTGPQWWWWQRDNRAHRVHRVHREGVGDEQPADSREPQQQHSRRAAAGQPAAMAARAQPYTPGSAASTHPRPCLSPCRFSITRLRLPVSLGLVSANENSATACTTERLQAAPEVVRVCLELLRALLECMAAVVRDGAARALSRLAAAGGGGNSLLIADTHPSLSWGHGCANAGVLLTDVPPPRLTGVQPAGTRVAAPPPAPSRSTAHQEPLMPTNADTCVIDVSRQRRV